MARSQSPKKIEINFQKVLIGFSALISGSQIVLYPTREPTRKHTYTTSVKQIRNLFQFFLDSYQELAQDSFPVISLISRLVWAR